MDTKYFSIFNCNIACNYGGMFCAIGQWGMVPDTVDYGEWKTGIRSEAIPLHFSGLHKK